MTVRRMMALFGAVLALCATNALGEAVKPSPAQGEAKAEGKSEAKAEGKSEAKAEEPVPAPVVDLETLSTSKIDVVRVRRMPRNFNDVGSLQWSSDGKRLLVDRIQRRSYDIVEIEVPEVFSEETPLPERVLIASDISTRKLLHYGAPAWLGPDCNYFAYVSQIPGSRDFNGSRPENGTHCNLAFSDVQGKRNFMLTYHTYSMSNPRGVSSPTFSPNGKFLAWSGLSSATRPGVPSIFGSRSLYIGAFTMVRGVPRLSGVQEIVDSRHGSFYENYGFTADGKHLIYSATRFGQPWFNMNLFKREIGSTHARCLTIQCGGWNRWATLSPKGHKIVWSSSYSLTNPNLGIGGQRWRQELRTDLWIMNADGSDKRRLTHFNTLDSRDNRILGLTPYEHCYVARSAWHPDGRKLAVVVCFGNRRFANSIVLMLDLAELGTVMQ